MTWLAPIDFNFMGIAEHQFNEELMRSKVSPEVYLRFKDLTRTQGTQLTQDDKEAISQAMGKWAMEKGAVQFSHIFFPIRSAGCGVLGGSAGLKHDAFLNLNIKSGDAVKPIINEFSAAQLFMGETDGSSFPHGGLRATHTAGAWTSWDMSSPPYIIKDTLYIPCIFVSQYGKALDEKTPLLRANRAVNDASLRLLRLMGDEKTTYVQSNVGPEQEFFIIDRDLYLQRPDLQCCGRTVVGASPAKGQQESLNYFSQVQPRVKQFFIDFHKACWKLGISNAVMHNEVAPAQCEFSHIFTLTNVAADWNVLGMDVMNEIAIRHGLVVLLHEKPFAGMNGSGKHNNWGLFSDEGDVFYNPGETKWQQERFMIFTAALCRALNQNADLFRAACASAGNDHRLGAQEAPPAIMSLCLGDELSNHIDSIIAGGPLEGYATRTKVIETGAPSALKIHSRFEDRNRTAPFPFCGNRFEFRAVGSSQNIAWPLTIINSTVADSINFMCDTIQGGKSVRDVVAETYAENKKVIFNGDGYADEWKVEAEKRGLPNLSHSLLAIDRLSDQKNLDLFDRTKVLDNEELRARREMMYDAYVNSLCVESQVMIDMMNTGVIPAAAKDLQAYAGPSAKLAGKRADIYAELMQETEKLEEVASGITLDDSRTGAWYCYEHVKPQMEKVRKFHDQVERLISRSLYPFPSYHDMLFSHHSGKVDAAPEQATETPHSNGMGMRMAREGSPHMLSGNGALYR